MKKRKILHYYTDLRGRFIQIMSHPKKIAVLVSGGVDSSVALALLKDQGYDVTAFYLKIWLEDEFQYLGDCPWEEDMKYVKKTCEQLGVKHEVISLQREYWDKVVAETIAEVKAGRTPNPDIWCNEKVKFGSFYEKIPDEFEKVATGHYAGVEEKKIYSGESEDNHLRLQKYFLKVAPDPVKDQTYFLSRLTQDQLSRAVFPLGEMMKSEVRELAEKYHLPTESRPDSQGICFLGQFKFSDFVRQHLGEKQGKIIEKETGKILGEHPGFWFYTFGQRHGLDLSGGPWYVVGKEAEENIVFVSRDIPADSGRNQIQINRLNWIPEKVEEGEYQIKLRHGEKYTSGILSYTNDDTAEILLNTPDRGIAPGQSAVLYQDGFCLGGGIIA